MKKLFLLFLAAIPFVIFGQNVSVNLNSVALGNTYLKTTFTNTSDFTVTGMTPTIVSGAIRLPAGTSDFTKYMTLTGSTNTDENIEMVVEGILQSAPSSTGYGIAIGKRSVNTTFANTVAGQMNMATGGASGVYINQGSFTNINSVLDATLATFASGNAFRIRWKQIKNVIDVTVTNITTNYVAHCSYKDSLITTTGTGSATPYLPPTSIMAIYQVGTGVIDITSVRVTSSSLIKQKLWFAGDSKTFGYCTGDITKRFATLLGGQVYAGGGDKTNEMVLGMPYFLQFLTNSPTVVLCIGRNDIVAAISSATYQANYISIVTSLTNAGCKVLHLLPIPETTATQTALRTFIISQYGISNCIDPIPAFQTSKMQVADGVHENALGAQTLADIIQFSLN